MQEEIVPLSNAFSNRIDNLVNTSNKKNVISRCQTKNATSPQLLGIERNKVANYSDLKKVALGRDKVANHSKIEEWVIKIGGKILDSL